MESLHTIILLTFLSSFSANAQCRIDSFSNNFGFAPVAQAIPCMHRGAALGNGYVLQVYFPISEPVPPITYHYLTINGFSGLPQGITYTKYPPQDTILPGGRQCFVFQGTTNDSTGRYNFTTLGNVKATIIGVDTTLSINTASQLLHSLPIANYSGFAYYFNVCPAAGIANFNDQEINIYPNPSYSLFNIDYMGNGSLHCILTNLLGEQLSAFELNSSHSQIDLSTLKEGIYSLYLSKENETIKVFKIVKTSN